MYTILSVDKVILYDDEISCRPHAIGLWQVIRVIGRKNKKSVLNKNT